MKNIMMQRMSVFCLLKMQEIACILITLMGAVIFGIVIFYFLVGIGWITNCLSPNVLQTITQHERCYELRYMELGFFVVLTGAITFLTLFGCFYRFPLWLWNNWCRACDIVDAKIKQNS